MTLIVVILVFIAQRYLELGEKIARTNGVKAYVGWMQSLLQKTHIWANLAGIIIILFPIAIVVLGLQIVLHNWILGVVRFFFDFLILWFCLDAYPLKQRLTEYFMALSQKDFAKSQQQAMQLLGEQHKNTSEENVSDIARAITCAVFLRADERLFGVLFWFIALGPFGAVIYFLIVTLRDFAAAPNSAFVELLTPINTAFGIVNWLPVRAIGLGYALMGYFMAAFTYIRKNFSKGIYQTTEFAIQVGFSALNMEHIDVVYADAEENQEAMALIDRATYLWIVFIALITLGGWL